MAGRRVGRLWLRDGFLFEAPTRPALALCQDAAPTPHSTVVPQSGSFIRLDLRTTIPALLRRFLPPLIPDPSRRLYAVFAYLLPMPALPR